MPENPHRPPTMQPHTVPHETWTLVTVSLGTFMLLLDITIVVVALPAIQHDLGGGFSQIQWTVDAYALALAALLLPTGSLADHYGRRRLFATGLIVFTIGSVLCGLSHSPSMLITCRAAQGVGGAAVFATSLALLAQTFQGHKRAMAIGIWGAVSTASTAIGPVLGGVITTEFGWRWIFLINLPIGVIAIGAALLRLDESRHPNARRPDLAGALLFALSLLAIVFGLIRAGHDGWSNTTVTGALLLGALLLVAFLATEARIRQPMFDLTLFRKPTFVGGSIAALVMNGSLYAMSLYLVLYLQDGLHYSPLQTSLRLLVITGATLLTGLPAGRLSGHLSTRYLIGPGLLLVGIGLLLMRGLSANSTWTHLIPGFIVAGLGAGLVNPPLASTAVGVVNQQNAGVASGMSNTFRQVGIAGSVAVLGSLLASKLGNDSHAKPLAPLSDAINELLLISAVIAFTGAILSTMLIRQRDFLAHRPPPTLEHA